MNSSEYNSNMNYSVNSEISDSVMEVIYVGSKWAVMTRVVRASKEGLVSHARV